MSGAIHHPSPRSVCFPFITAPMCAAPHHNPYTDSNSCVCVFVRVCMCVIYSGYGLKQEQVINSVTSWQEGKSKCCSAYS